VLAGNSGQPQRKKKRRGGAAALSRSETKEISGLKEGLQCSFDGEIRAGCLLGCPGGIPAVDRWLSAGPLQALGQSGAMNVD
jgi:hypothetical protein